MGIRCPIVIFLTVANAFGTAVHAGGPLCPTNTGPDVIVSTLTNVTIWGVVDNIAGYSLGSISCNIGDSPIPWAFLTNQHPVIAQNLFRVADGRIEQLGMSWVKHGFAAVTGSTCCTCIDPGTTAELGVGCSDPYSSFLNGDQDGFTIFGDDYGGLGPRFDVNPVTGVFTFPYPFMGVSGDAKFKRIQVNIDDIDPALNPDATYIGEVQYITPHDAAAGNGNNNVSYAVMNIGPPANGGWQMTSGTTQVMQPAIVAWQNIIPDVTIQNIQVPNDGLFMLGHLATDNLDGTWHYEYALYNMNSHRSAQSFSVPVPDGVAISNIGFHDVNHHSGEPYDGSDWPGIVSGGAVVWQTEDFSVDENANALRWGTMYNFRFDADTPPASASATVGLFRPPPIAGKLNAMTVSISAPSVDPCPADCALPNNGLIDVHDLLRMLSDWDGGNSLCDVDNSGSTDIMDLLAILGAWGVCP